MAPRSRTVLLRHQAQLRCRRPRRRRPQSAWRSAAVQDATGDHESSCCRSPRRAGGPGPAVDRRCHDTARRARRRRLLLPRPEARSAGAAEHGALHSKELPVPPADRPPPQSRPPAAGLLDARTLQLCVSHRACGRIRGRQLHRKLAASKPVSSFFREMKARQSKR